MIGQRRRLIDYLKKHNKEKYKEIIEKLESEINFAFNDDAVMDTPFIKLQFSVPRGGVVICNLF